MHYFYSKDISGNNIFLSKEEAHHASRVLRMQIGDRVGVFNGEGNIYECCIADLTKSKCSLEIEKIIESDRDRSKLCLLIAPTKNNDRLEWFLEKATEIGVGEIVPIISEHSERKKIREDRFEKVIVSAMKQSMNPYLPILKPLQSFKEVIQSYPSYDRFISHCNDLKKENLFDQLDFQKESAILIGPEGDFSINEVQEAEQLGWKGVSMGHQRLRTETAGVLAVHMYSLKEGNNF